MRDKRPISIKSITDKKLKSKLKKSEAKSRFSALKSAQSELLLTEQVGYLEAQEMEKTWKFTQQAIKSAVDVNTSRKMFDLTLDQFGPYTLNYSRNGSHLLIGGRKGHVASFDWKSHSLDCELHLNETVKDVVYLHNHSMFAVAQKKYTYIYDSSGMELHCLKDHIEANKLQFLPYHFLLASVV